MILRRTALILTLALPARAQEEEPPAPPPGTIVEVEARKPKPPSAEELEGRKAEAELRTIFEALLRASKHKGDVEFRYRHDLDFVVFQCGPNQLIPGGFPAGYAYCDGQVPGDGTVFAGRSIWHLARDDEQAALLLAHELGHIVLEHGPAMVKRSSKLFRAWLDEQKVTDVTANAKRDELKQEYRFRRGEEHKKAMDAYAAELERAADRFAPKLLKKAGVDPLDGATALLNVPDLAAQTGHWGILYADETHDPFDQRFRHTFDEAFADLP